MDRSWHLKRVSVCTFVALLSGILSAYLGSQISLQIHRQKCQNQPWGFKTVCHTWVAPGAIWQGGTTGFALGTVLGGLASVATFKKAKSHPQDEKPLAFALQADVELTSEQRELLRRFLILIILKLASDPTASDADIKSISLEKLQQLLATAKQQRFISKDFTLADADKLIKALGVDAQPSQIKPPTSIPSEPAQRQTRLDTSFFDE